MARPQALREAVASLATARSQTKTPGRYRVRIIEADRWGSSAYYPAEVLRRDAAVFKAGTHAYFDHPTMTESVERPERSLRDLAGRLVTDATFDGDGLYAEMEVFPHYREIVESMADVIGLSIRANGTVEHAEIAGRSGPVLTGFTEAQSVDFVTAAGAGGRLVQLLESALAERKSVSWNEHDHPRAADGKFSSGGGGGSGGSGGSGGRVGRSRASVVQTGSGPVTVMRHADGSGSVQVGGQTIRLGNSNEFGKAANGIRTPASPSTKDFATPEGKNWQSHAESDGKTLAVVTRTGQDDYQLHLPPHDGASLEQTRDAPGIPLTGAEVNKIRDTMLKQDRDAKAEEKAAKAAARRANIDAGAVNHADVARRAGGKAPSTESADGRGLPDTIASRQLTTAGGDELTLHREAGDDYVHVTNGDRSFALTPGELDRIKGAVSLDDDEDMEDGRKILADDDGNIFGQVTEVGRNQFQVQIDGQDAFTLGKRDSARLDRANTDLGAAQRFDTGNGPVDMYVGDRQKPTLRVVDAEGNQRELAFNQSSAEKLSSAFSVVYEGVDETEEFVKGDASEHVTSLDVKTNVGQVRVEGIGDWRRTQVNGTWVTSGEAVEVGATDGSWKIRLDGEDRAGDFQRALTDLADAAISESRRRRTGGVPLVEARTVGAWVESRLHLALTTLADDMYGDGRLTRPERITLSSAVGEALDAFTARVKADAPQLYTRGPYDDPPPAAGVATMSEAASMSAEDLRTQLSAAVRAAHGGDDVWTWVRDWTDTWVVYTRETTGGVGSDAGLYQQTYTLDSGGQVTLTGQPVEVVARTTYDPQPKPASTPPTGKADKKPGPGTPPAKMEEGSMPEITPEQAAQLAEAANLKTSLEQALTELREARTEITQLRERADTADTKAQRLENERAARELLTTSLAESGIPATSHPGVTDTVLRDLPLTESGALDTTAFGTLVETAITAKKTELAALLEAAGVGSVRGLGESLTGQAREEITAEQATTSLVESYRARGLSEDAARLAAAGRPF